MDRSFAIYHGLVAGAPWGVAVERANRTPKVDLLALCRTEEEAERHAKLLTRDSKAQTPDAKRTGGKTT